MERRVLRAASVGAAMGADILINYPLWIVAKRVGAGLSALPPLHRLYAGGGALWISIAPTTIIEDGVSTVLKPRCGDLAASAASGAIDTQSAPPPAYSRCNGGSADRPAPTRFATIQSG